MLPTILNDQENINFEEILSFNKPLSKEEQILSNKKIKIKISEIIDTSLRPKVIALNTDNNSSEIIGKLLSNNSEPILGVAIDSNLANEYNEIISEGYIRDDALTGGVNGQNVYCNNSGELSLISSGLKIGKLITSSSPIYIFINPTREFDETQPNPLITLLSTVDSLKTNIEALYNL